MPDPIVVITKNPADITLQETEEIAELIRGLDLDLEVQVESKPRGGYGVTWFEVLVISAATKLGDAVIKKLVDVTVEWARQRFRGRKSGSKRPVSVSIYGPDGMVKSVVIKNADEVEDRTDPSAGKK
jgi:hypothetical protein